MAWLTMVPNVPWHRAPRRNAPPRPPRKFFRLFTCHLYREPNYWYIRNKCKNIKKNEVYKNGYRRRTCTSKTEKIHRFVRFVIYCSITTVPVAFYWACTVWVKKVAPPLKLFAIFSLRLSVFSWNFADLLAVCIHTCLPISVYLS